MRSFFTALLIIISIVTVYSCKKSSINPPKTAASIVGKWLYSKEEEKVYDPSGKLVVDTLFETGLINSYQLYNTNGNIYNVSVQNNVADTLSVFTYKLNNNTLTTTYTNSSGYEIGSILQLNAQTLEIEYRFSTYGDESAQVQLFHLDPSLTYQVQLYEYNTRQ